MSYLKSDNADCVITVERQHDLIDMEIEIVSVLEEMEHINPGQTFVVFYVNRPFGRSFNGEATRIRLKLKAPE